MFFCEFCEISKNTFLQNTSGQLLLNEYLTYADMPMPYPDALAILLQHHYSHLSSLIPFTMKKYLNS